MSMFTTVSSLRVATATIMLFALAIPSSRRGAIAFSSTIRTRACTSTIIPNGGSRTTATMRPSSGKTARFMSTKLSHDDYSSMSIAELREMLRARGLKVSGIKADLIERLETGEINVGNKPKKVVEKNPKKKKEKKAKKNDVEEDHNIGSIEYDDDTVKNDLSGLLDQLKEGGPADSREQKYPRTLVFESKEQSPPQNLVFAKEGDDYGSDDEWYADDDEDEDDDGDFDPNKTIGFDPNKTVDKTRNKRLDKPAKSAVTFKEDFQGTRVFVQGLPEEATWQDLKDHFQIAGEVVFASVSIDKRTGKSKQCGIVQFETPAMAHEAIRDMRNHPMNGAKLYVRKDVQESQQRDRGSRQRDETRRDDWERDDDRSEYRRNSAPPTEWKRANDPDVDGGGDNWYNLKDEELKEIEDIIEKRDRQRRQKNYKMSDKLRNTLKEEFGVHLDDTHKMWWTDTKHGGVPEMVSDVKGEGRWGKQTPWRQIPTTPENDAMVDSDRVMQLLLKRDRARRRKDFDAADDLLQKAYDSPQGGLGLRIHDESRTWRIWTEKPPPRKDSDQPSGYEKLTPAEMCLQIVTENEPEKVDEMKELLRKFPGREWNIFKRLKGRYNDDNE